MLETSANVPQVLLILAGATVGLRVCIGFDAEVSRHVESLPRRDVVEKSFSRSMEDPPDTSYQGFPEQQIVNSGMFICRGVPVDFLAYKREPPDASYQCVP